MLRRVAPAAVLSLVLLSAPATASASETPPPFALVLGSVVLAVADVGFLLADLGYGAEGEWLPLYGAWTQLVLMTSANYVVGILMVDQSHTTAGIALGVGEILAGTWFAIHGILSILGQPDEPPPQQALFLTPLGLAGRF